MSVRRGDLLWFVLAVCAAIGSLAWAPVDTYAASVSEIQSQIDDRNQQIAELQADIAKYQAQLDAIGKQKSTLQSTINQLTISRQKLSADLAVTGKKIDNANLKLEELGLAIDDKQSSIESHKVAIGKALRDMNDSDSASLVERIFAAGELSDAWVAADELTQFNRALQADIAALSDVKQQLADNRDQVAQTKAELVSLQSDQLSQRKAIDANRSSQQALLAQTKNKESSYQKLIADKKAAEAQFEDELAQLAEQLKLAVNPDALPHVGSGVLAWPFSAAFMAQCAARQSVFDNPFCITQYFGNTPFATANAQIYNGHGHNAIDMGVPVGTPVHAALSGTVLGTGNTDAVRGCYSFGKWVMIEHDNGLSTLYAHLSEIDTSKGTRVATGQVIGYSGMTGYATGPHLHFGVYATSGTKIMTLGAYRGTKTPCANATMPVASVDAYLNPMSYL